MSARNPERRGAVHLRSCEIELNGKGTGEFIRLYSLSPSEFYVTDTDGSDLAWFGTIKDGREYTDMTAKNYFK